MASDRQAKEGAMEGKVKEEGRYPLAKAGAVQASVHPVVVLAEIMQSVSKGIQGAAGGAGLTGVTVMEAISVIVRRAMRETRAISDDLMLSSKAILLGVIRETGKKGAPALKIMSHTARRVVRETATMNGDVTAAVMGLVQGAAAAADCIDVTPTKAAWVVSGAAIEEAYQVNSPAVQEVRKALATLDK